MSDWLRSRRAWVAARSGWPPAKLTIARRVHVMWSSQSLRIASCRRAALALVAAAGVAAAWAWWWAGTWAVAPPVAARPRTAAAETPATASAARVRMRERRCTVFLLDLMGPRFALPAPLLLPSDS